MDHVALSDAVFAHHVQPINSHLGLKIERRVR